MEGSLIESRSKIIVNNLASVRDYELEVKGRDATLLSIPEVVNVKVNNEQAFASISLLASSF